MTSADVRHPRQLREPEAPGPAGGPPSPPASPPGSSSLEPRLSPSGETEPAEYDLSSGPGGRFDQPSPVQLETGGVTAPISPPLRTSVPHASQPEFWSSQTTHKNSVAAKLRTAGRPDLAQDLEDCHSRFTYAVCNDCGRVGKFPNRCDRHYCPECQPRLAHERKEAVQWWVTLIEQPKHVVLTLRNVPDLTRAHVKEAKKWLAALRRRKFCRPWRGGFYSIEVTNEGRGWHLHFHLLVDCRWIDAGQLAVEWNKTTAGGGHIVKVKDARGHDYLREVTKYTVKGSQLAAWTPDQVRTFVEVFDGVRTFGVFGTLYGARTEFAEWLKEIRDKKPRCECGSCDVSYYNEVEFLELDLQPTIPTKPKPPPPDFRQLALLEEPQPLRGIPD